MSNNQWPQYNSRMLSSQFTSQWGAPYGGGVQRHDAVAAEQADDQERSDRMDSWDNAAQNAQYTGYQSQPWLRQESYDSSKW